MRNIWTSMNIGCYLIDGCNKLLPKDIREKLDGKKVEIRYPSYPLKLVGKHYWENRVGFVESPKTYGDLMKPYEEWFIPMADIVDNDKSDKYYCCNSVFDCYLDGIAIDCENKIAVVYIGS